MQHFCYFNNINDIGPVLLMISGRIADLINKSSGCWEKKIQLHKILHNNAVLYLLLFRTIHVVTETYLVKVKYCVVMSDTNMAASYNLIIIHDVELALSLKCYQMLKDKRLFLYFEMGLYKL